MQVNPNIISTTAYQKIDKASRKRLIDTIRNEFDLNSELNVDSAPTSGVKFIAETISGNQNKTFEYYDKENTVKQILPGQIFDRRG
jgi:hypothetical protein